MTPTGIDHIKLLETLAEAARRASEDELNRHSCDLAVIGSSLVALYEASTCAGGSRGGPHVLEALAGRAYNLGCAAYLLISRALYDEALNLTRSLGELSNIISLSVVDEDALARWLASDHRTRMRDFSPAAVRRLLEAQATELMYADKDWYSGFCEKFTHGTPSTMPNVHNEHNLSIVGGILQPEGLAYALGELAMVLGFIALPICKYFNLDGRFSEITAAVRENSRSDQP